MPDQFPKPPLVWNNQLDPTPMEIRMSGHRLKIPRNYIDRGGVASNGQVGFVLMAKYPGLAGISESNFSTFSGLSEGKLKYMLRGTTNMTPNVVTIYRVDRYFPAGRKVMFSISKDAGEKSTIDGLLRMPHEYHGKYIVGDGGFMYVHAPDDVDGGVIIDCLSSDRNKTYDDFESGNMTTTIPGLQECHVDISVNGISFEYQFHFSLLRNWQEIHQGVISLLASFFED